MATEKLVVKITANASQAKGEINKFKATLSSMKNEAKSGIAGMAGLSAELGTLAVAAGGAVAAVTALAAGVKNAINVAALGDEIKDQAQKVFMSTTAYQEWGYVLKQNGVDMAALKMGMRTFAKEVAAGDSALAQYGVTSNNIETAFGQAMSSIQNIESETERVAAATQLFGTRALELMPIFNLTNAETQNLMASYRALGGTMSNELIAASDVCTDSIMAMGVSWQGLKNTLAQAFLPAIIKVVQWITVAIAKVRILLAAIFGVKATFGSKGNKKSIVGSTGSVAGNTGKTANNMKKAAKHAKELRRSLLKIDELTTLAAKASAAAASGGGGGGGSVGGVGGDIGGAGDIDSLLTDEQLESITKFQQKVESIKDKLEGLKDIWVGFIKLLVFHDRTGLDDIFDGLTKIFPQLETVREKWRSFKELVSEKIADVKINVVEKFSDVKEKWNTVKANITDKIVNITAKIPTWSSLKTSWNNLLNNFKNKTITITIKLNNLLKSAWNALAKKINAARNTAIGKKLLPKMPLLAKGGVLTSPTMAIMGEYSGAQSNPEIATPQKLMYDTMLSANGELVSSFAQMTRQVIAAIENKDMSVSIGDEQVARSAQRGNKAHYQRTGKALITV